MKHMHQIGGSIPQIAPLLQQSAVRGAGSFCPQLKLLLLPLNSDAVLTDPGAALKATGCGPTLNK